ncbi:MAG: hypothetical protein IKW67_03450 [Alphaproteobacteria bacterium]|nr:hypothetical protein [Alphaproteobacteria bacterium]
MTQENKLSLSKWIFGKPAKFAITTFIILFITTILGAVIANTYKPIPYTLAFGILTFIFIYCIAKLIKQFKNSPMDKRSFIAIANGQWLTTIITSFITISISLIIMHSLHSTTFSTGTLIVLAITTIILSLFILYSIGLFFLNIYALYCRCIEMKIPTWKFIFSFPFGTTMFYAAGYLMNDPQKKKNSIEIQSNWYSKLTNWILQNKRNTIISFIIITLLSGILGGTNSVLLTFTMALIYGIWVLQTGEKQLQKNIGGKFSSVAVIINIILLITTIALVTFSAKTEPQITQSTESINIEIVEPAPQTEQ